MSKFLDKIIKNAILSGNVDFLKDFIANKNYKITYEHILICFKSQKNSAASLKILLDSCEDSISELKKITLTSEQIKQCILSAADKQPIEFVSNFDKIDLCAEKKFCFVKGERDNKWYLASIIKQEEENVLVHYEGYSIFFDLWLDQRDPTMFLAIQDFRIQLMTNLALASMVDVLLNLISIDPQSKHGLMLWKEIILAPEIQDSEKDSLLLELVSLGANFEFFPEEDLDQHDFVICDSLRP